jgi:hypothetical protein
VCHRIDEPGPAGIGLLLGIARGPSAAQLLGQFALQFAAGVDVDRLVDRFGAHAHLWAVGKVVGHPVTDLLGRPLLLQLPLNVGQ